mgnify:CR=1 FL=1
MFICLYAFSVFINGSQGQEEKSMSVQAARATIGTSQNREVIKMPKKNKLVEHISDPYIELIRRK